MTKQELVSALVQRTGVVRGEVDLIITAYLEIVGKTLTEGQDVFLRGFGTFQSHTYRARKGRIIAQNRTIDIPARRTIRFKPAAQLRNLPPLTDE